MSVIKRLVGVCVVIVLLITATAWGYDRYTATTYAYTSPAVQLNESALASELEATLQRNSDLDISISLVDLQTGKRYHWGETASYTAASIGKLITATAYLHRVELGNAGLGDRVGNLTAREQLTRLIEKSDNTAWHELNEIITKDGLQQYARSLGLDSYMPNNNILTSDDVALLLKKLASYTLLDKEHTDFLINLMQAADMQAYIVAAIPEGTDVYHKVGYLEDRLHDAAIIRREDRSYVLVIFSKSAGVYDFSRGAKVFQGITSSSLRAFFQ